MASKTNWQGGSSHKGIAGAIVDLSWPTINAKVIPSSCKKSSSNMRETLEGEEFLQLSEAWNII